jgi:hypothetical protein
MKKFIALSALGLVSAGVHTAANASGTYVATGNVQAYNPFATIATDLTGGPIAYAGTAVVTGSAVSVTGLQFSWVNTNATFNYTGGTWSTTLGGTSITHSETCVDISGAACSGALSGLGQPNWNNTQQNGGVATNTACPKSKYFSKGNCDRVSITENTIAGTLQIIEQSEFAINNTTSGYIYNFALVPVPAAVWLFGSAVGLLGLRRKTPTLDS